MIEMIGATAGQVWNYLEQNGEVTIATLKKELELKGEMAALAVGWLAREEKIEIIKKGNSVKVKLV